MNHFISEKISADLASGRVKSKIITRFPPEPNGYLHVGHVKAIHVNFSMSEQFNGHTNLRYDDTNPLAESNEYVVAIQENLQWLGYHWYKEPLFASDYFETLYQFAEQLIQANLAYVDFSTPEEIRKMRGTLTEPGQTAKFRDLPVEVHLAEFRKMRAGDYPDGHCVLRAKIDMSSPNMNMRDPLIYRIRHAHHHRTENKWCIYPLYDFQHPLSDMLEGVTHSLCSLEFEDHRPLYNWFLEALKTEHRPQQIEFARLNIDYTLLSKRTLKELVDEKRVSGWDDPRMPTLVGMRRRGYSALALKNFCDRIGVTKKNTVIALSTLEHAVREDLDHRSNRLMCVLDPIKVIITNFDETTREVMTGECHPKIPERGTRSIALHREIYIDREDFMENPPKDFFRLAPGGKVRLRYGYVIECVNVIKDSSGQVTELHCTYDSRTKAGVTPEGEKKVKGIIHWVSARENIPCEVRLYDRLFSDPEPSSHSGKDYREFINPESLKVHTQAFLEVPSQAIMPETHFQFERLGFFCSDRVDHTLAKPVFNRTVTLKDSWAKSNNS